MRRLSLPPSEYIHAAGAGLLILFFYATLLWRDPLLFWNDDYAISILPVFADVARAWANAEFPLLSRSSWICGNLAGEFQYGTFSLFVNAAVVAIWNFPLTFPQQAAALSMTHLFAFAMGAYMLARQLKLAPPLALMVTLIVACNGWIVCWGATDWFGALGALTWLPWCWWAGERALDPQRSKWRYLWPSPFVYLLVTGGFPYTVLMLALLYSWLSLRVAVEQRSLAPVWPLIAGSLLGLGLSAPAWLALLDYTEGSVRSARSGPLNRQWMVPIQALPSFFLPSWTVRWPDFHARPVFHTGIELACGLVAPAVLASALITRFRETWRRHKWVLAFLAFVLLLSVLPSAGLFRWSFRWLPLVHLILALLAARLLQQNGTKRPALVALGALALFTALTLLIDPGTLFLWPLAAILSALAIIWIFWRTGWAAPVLTFTSLIATYFCIPTNVGVPKYNFTTELREAAPLAPNRLYLSIYPSPEEAYRMDRRSGPVGRVVRPGSTPMWANLRFINGYSPILGAEIAREFAASIHGWIDPGMGQYLAEYQAGPDGQLAQLGVDGMIIASEYNFAPLPADQWQLVHTANEGRVYHRAGGPIPSVRSVPTFNGAEYAVAEVEEIVETRNTVSARVTVPAEGKALLLFSRPHFEGYKAWLNEKPLPVSSWRGLIPVLELPAGSSGRLEMRYQPDWLIYGLALAGISFAVIVIRWW